MALYEYDCGGCGAFFEARLKFEERLAGQACPACGARQSSLRLSVPARVAASGGGETGADIGYCPTSGSPCGCPNALRN